jgi:pyruvate/2-oxoglutarate dehydrogenase complex dihydrolipoamide acyltransferase (E2) component
MDGIGAYQEREFSASRNPTIDILELGRRKHHIPVLLEIDITESRKRLHEIKTARGRGISFTAWVMACIGQAASEHKRVHALRKGRKRLVVFDDVDISVLVERVVNRQAGQTETLPMPYVVRKANEKSVQAIHTEIRAAQAVPVTKGEVQIDSTRQAFATRLFARLPRFLRNLIVWQPLLNNPLRTKRTMGTVVVTSIGNIGKSNDSSSGWAIPTGIHALVVAVGSIARKPGIIGDAIEIREYLSMTVLFDHDVVDGAPVARFVQRLKELLETCYGLDEAFEAANPAV